SATSGVGASLIGIWVRWRPRTAVFESSRRASSQTVADILDPLFRRHAVGPELLQPVLLLAGEEGAVATQLAGGGRVEQTAGVGRAHLEEHAHFELAQLLVREVAIEVVHGVAPGDQVHAQARTFAEDHVKVVRRREVILWCTNRCDGGVGGLAGRWTSMPRGWPGWRIGGPEPESVVWGFSI